MSAESGPELGVVCRNCGSEVSAYVTECPYCGQRLRKRAPRLERSGDQIRVHESPREKRRKRRRERVRERSFDAAGERPWATIVLVAAPALLLLVQRAGGLSGFDLGAINLALATDWWRYLTAPFVYVDVGYLFVAALSLAILVPALERRLGSLAALVLALTGGVAGLLAAAWISELGIDENLVAAGGNVLALTALGVYAALRRAELREGVDDGWDVIGVVTMAAVLLALPLVEDTASAVAGLAALGAGGILGVLSALLGLARR